MISIMACPEVAVGRWCACAVWRFHSTSNVSSVLGSLTPFVVSCKDRVRGRPRDAMMVERNDVLRGGPKPLLGALMTHVEKIGASEGAGA